MEASVAVENKMISNEIKQEVKVEEANGVSESSQQPYSNGQIGQNGQNGKTASSWNDGQGNGMQGNQYGDMAVEPENHGIGIKEDG